MTTAVAASPKLLTAEEYLRLPKQCERSELVRGAVIAMNLPGFRHGQVCGNIQYWIGNFVRENDVGRVLSNDAGVVTQRDPDTVRGPDISFYSYQRVPREQAPVGYAATPPEIVFEVVSPSNTRPEIAVKTGEYLRAGIKVVCVVDPQYRTVNLHYPDRPDEKLQGDNPLKLEDLPGFDLPVARLFE